MRFTIQCTTVSPEADEGADTEVASVHKARKHLEGPFNLSHAEADSMLALAQRSALEAMNTGDSMRSI